MSQKTEMLQDAAMQILANQTQEQEHQDTLKEIGQLEACPVTQYDTIEQAYNHRSTVEGLQKDLVAKQAEANPYTEQILELSHTALQELDWNMINELTKVKDHQEFLYKLLTNKDSFVRKRIIDQNLAFLNQRLTYYLDRIGLPHIVEFQNDLTVTITQLGQDLDFDNLSRGERNRLILSLSWAFRDVWENLYHPINLLFIDELVDSGMDASGVESSIAVLKKMTRERNKNVFLISHRDDLTSRVNHVLKVIKENGFTSYSTDIDIIE
jgi:DNA repair exonuclease SbcCD ATPase subunit